ncbi:hypothetical protein CSUI_010498 [Cystoisospora suis]|uniref:Uncharacterized protein n=1 Tax=Cystoisospora suis TaxID=483139 RepID=A0A2C6JAZ9_9APIC|nr:hypothetical protein CSUI_010498 [Cystoisospora suis]
MVSPLVRLERKLDINRFCREVSKDDLRRRRCMYTREERSYGCFNLFLTEQKEREKNFSSSSLSSSLRLPIQSCKLFRSGIERKRREKERKNVLSSLFAKFISLEKKRDLLSWRGKRLQGTRCQRKKESVRRRRRK